MIQAFIERSKIVENPIKTLESIIEALIKIDSNPRWKPFRFDPDHSFKCRLNTIIEALAAIACEQQGLLSELVRDTVKGRGDFIDKLGKIWDVKSFVSYSTIGAKEFTKEYFKDYLNNELLKPENIIIDISRLIPTDIADIYDVLKLFSKTDIERILIVDRINLANSKKTADLLKFLGF